MKTVITVLFVATTLNLHAFGQTPKHTNAPQAGVDIVTLKTGRTIRGAVFKADPAGAVTMVVTREWLQSSLPDLFSKTISHQKETTKAAAEQLRDRIKNLLKAQPKGPGFEFLLKQELDRIQKVLIPDEPIEPEQFLWVELPHETVAKVNRAPADRRQIATWAWNEYLPKVETRDTRDLERDLKQRGVDVALPAPDLSDRLPPRLQDDREWAARIALVEYSLVKQLDFQGTEDVLIRTDKEQNPLDLAPVFQRVLRSQVDSLLSELTGTGRPPAIAKPSDWLKSATQEADGLARNGFRATRVEIKLEGNQAIVETAFAAKLPKGELETIWHHREIQDATKIRADLEERIGSDPQVKQGLDAAKSIGLNADAQIRQAIRFGAATMAAQQAADSKFFEFRDRYLKRLDTPPLSWSR